MKSIADELIVRGWHQGGYEGPDGSVCLEGAARCAGWVDRLGFTDYRALDALREAVGGAAFLFNDAPDRTFDEVLRVAKQADEILGA